ncbi:Hypothetical predicted protein, partial [Pelobates cultripes]
LRGQQISLQKNMRKENTRFRDNSTTVLRSEIAALGTRTARLEERLEATNKETFSDPPRRSGINMTEIHRKKTLGEASRAKQAFFQLRHTEDLDNRGRRSNIRVRGIPESAGDEDVEALLRALFRGILGAETPATIEFDRAHRANRLRTMEGTPRDVICCMHQYKLKEKIMAKARSRPTWRFQDADVALYQDLSPLTLEARRALRPITTQLQERRITYKWGYPFALLARNLEDATTLPPPHVIPKPDAEKAFDRAQNSGDEGLHKPWIVRQEARAYSEYESKERVFTMQQMAQHLEDLDNRGRRQNIRVRGIPEEADDDTPIQVTLQTVFNQLLGRAPREPLEMVRAHRALRPKGPPGSQPRDAICCLANFQQKEDILRKAREEVLEKVAAGVGGSNATSEVLPRVSAAPLKESKLLETVLEIFREEAWTGTERKMLLKKPFWSEWVHGWRLLGRVNPRISTPAGSGVQLLTVANWLELVLSRRQQRLAVTSIVNTGSFVSLMETNNSRPGQEGETAAIMTTNRDLVSWVNN